MKISLGFVQRAALETYVFESIHDEDRPGGLTLDGASLVVDCDPNVAHSYLMDAVNSADDSGDAQWRDALAAVAHRVLLGGAS